MTDEQAQALIDGMAKITEKVDVLSTENAELKNQLEALKPEEETEEQKTAREAQEATDAQALKDTLQKDDPSPKTYNSQVDAKITAGDKLIVPLKVAPMPAGC